MVKSKFLRAKHEKIIGSIFVFTDTKVIYIRIIYGYIGCYKKYGFTVKQVSVGMGYSPDTLPNIIYNTRNPQYETLRKIADYLGCHISEFFYDEPITHHGEVVKTEDSLEIANGQPHLRIRSVMRMQGVTSVALGILFSWLLVV